MGTLLARKRFDFGWRKHKGDQRIFKSLTISEHIEVNMVNQPIRKLINDMNQVKMERNQSKCAKSVSNN